MGIPGGKAEGVAGLVTHCWVRPFCIELTSPFAISGGTHARADIIVVGVELDDGTLGLGEAAPLPAYNGETVAAALAVLETVVKKLPGRRIDEWEDILDSVNAHTVTHGAALCAVETAVLDAWTRHRKQSLLSWFGAQSALPLTIDVTIPIVTPEQAARDAMQWRAKGFDTFKIKLGGSGDFERVMAVHQQVPEARLLVDANAGLTPKEAVHLVESLERCGVHLVLFEQPVPRGDWEGLRQVRASGVDIAIDESLVSESDAEEALRELGSECVFNIKLMKAGIREATKIVTAAKRGGARLMIGGMVESVLAMTTSACFALGHGGFEFADLDTHLFLVDSSADGWVAPAGVPNFRRPHPMGPRRLARFVFSPRESTARLSRVSQPSESAE